MTFFERLKKIRLNRGLTQKQVAIGVHITEQSYQRYERGATRPGLDILIALADYFNVSIDYLVGRGFFADWDRIWEHKDDIVKALKAYGSFYQELFSRMPPDATELDYVLLFPALLAKVEFQGNDLSIYPLIPGNIPYDD